MNSWQLIFANALTDYVTTNYVAPAVGGSTIGTYLVGGLNFAAKEAAAKTGYITSFSLGGMMGGQQGASPATH